MSVCLQTCLAGEGRLSFSVSWVPRTEIKGEGRGKPGMLSVHIVLPWQQRQCDQLTHHSDTMIFLPWWTEFHWPINPNNQPPSVDSVGYFAIAKKTNKQTINIPGKEGSQDTFLYHMQRVSWKQQSHYWFLLWFQLPSKSLQSFNKKYSRPVRWLSGLRSMHGRLMTEFDPQELHGGRRELKTASRHSMCVPTHTCTHAHTHKYKSVRKKKKVNRGDV